MSADGWLRISEIFESIQGEGACAGAPSVFLRLAACNLRCRWCDTRYTWDWSAYRYEDEVRRVSVTEVALRLRASAAPHLVVTGGEPLLQQPALAALFESLGSSWFVEVETNGTLAPCAPLARRVDQWNVSPKLANSGEPRERRIVADALGAFLRTGHAWLKLVIEAEEDMEESDALLRELEWPKERVLFMPQASSRTALSERAPLVARLARERGIHPSPRLHIERWDGRRGV